MSEYMPYLCLHAMSENTTIRHQLEGATGQFWAEHEGGYAKKGDRKWISKKEALKIIREKEQGK